MADPHLPRGAAHYVHELTRIAPGRPALMLGVRIALVTTLPLALAPWLGPVVATWASTGGFSVALADKGGSYRTRAATMGLVTLFSALLVGLGTLAATHSALAVPLMFLTASGCAFVGAAGPSAAGGGVTVAVLFAIALAAPPQVPTEVAREAAERALAVLGAGAWAMVLALVFWPVRVYKPARFAVARALGALARHAQLLGGLGDAATRSATHAALSSAHAAVRAEIEAARGVLAATRRGRRGESGRGASLLALLQLVEMAFGTLLALEEEAEGLAELPPPPLWPAVDAAVGRVAALLVELEARVVPETRLPPAPAVTLVAPLRAAAASSPDDPARARRIEHVALLLGDLETHLRTGLEIVGALYADQTPQAAVLPPPTADEPRPLVQIFGDHLTPQSIFFRHALRVGVTTAAAVALARALALHRGYWVTLTVLILLQPYTPATLAKALSRVAGTVLGGMLAALLLHFVRDRTLLMVLATLLAGTSAAVLQLNYALYAFFLTPTFVLLAEANLRDPHLATLRITNTLIGGLLALLGARLLWPYNERARFPDDVADALAALARYLAALGDASEDPNQRRAARRAARRQLGLAISRADAAFQRLLAEGAAPPETVEPIMTLLLFVRRMASTIANAGSALRLLTPDEIRTFSGFVDDAVTQLDEVAAAVRDQRAPRTGRLPETPVPPALAPRPQRIGQQLAVLRHAALRWMAPAVADTSLPGL